jgi:all-trans-retinol 13,14-reductase
MSRVYDAIVIGSGLGGLTAGALCAKSGQKVLLLEQHNIFGGAATVFARKNLRVEVGLHEIDGLDAADLKNDLFDQLDIPANVTFVPVPEFYSVRHRSLGDKPFVMPEGTAAAQCATTERFPRHKKAINTWFKTLDSIHGLLRTIDDNHDNPGWKMINGPVFPMRFWPLIRHDRTTVGDFLQNLFGHDEAVKLALCGNLNYYSDTLGMSFLFFAAGQSSYHRGGHYIRGGSQVLSDYLVQIILDAGGTARTSRPVVGILVEDGCAVGVEHTNHKGEDLQTDRARVIFGNAAPAQLAEMLPQPHMDDFNEKYADKPLSPSLWSVYLGLDRSPNELGMDHYSNFVFPDWMNGLDDLAESGALMGGSPGERMPFYVAVNYDQLDHGLENSETSFVVLCGVDRLKYWHGLTDEEYKERKEAWLAAIVQGLLEVYPALRPHIVFREMATAKSVHRYLKTPGGAVYGFEQAPNAAGRHRPGAKTSVSGLFLASAFAQPGGGFTGAMLAGQNAFRVACK